VLCESGPIVRHAGRRIGDHARRRHRDRPYPGPFEAQITVNLGEALNPLPAGGDVFSITGSFGVGSSLGQVDGTPSFSAHRR
jgi:hypothetical protein